MGTLFVTGTSDTSDGLLAGREVSKLTLQKLQGRSPNIALVFASAKYDLNKLLQGIHETVGEIPVVGCTAAGEFNEQNVIQEGVVCALISTDTHRFFQGIGVGLKEDEIKAVEMATKGFPAQVEGYPFQSAMLFIDGLVGKGEETVLAAASILGPNVKFSGGAAGDDLHFKNTFIFGDHGPQSDALSLCLIASKKPIFITAKHGHVPITPPLKVTKSKGNILYEIEGQPALEVWKSYVRHKVLKTLNLDVNHIKQPELLSQLLLKYEAGLMTGSDYKLRFPTSANADGSLNFVCSVTEGAAIKIMDSPEEAQIASAREAAQNAIKVARGVKVAGAVIFDCACRHMILKDKFFHAIEEMKAVLGKIPIIGCETYGEIAMEMGQLSGFHNTTTVIMLLPE